MSARRVTFILSANLDNWAKNLDKANKKLNRFATDISKIGRSMSTYLTAPLLAIGGASIKSAADFESLRISLDTLVGSAIEGEKAFKRLVELSSNTPFQLPDIVRANNTLMGFGRTAQEAFEDIKQIGDIASIVGGDMQSIAVAFGQSAAEGKLFSKDIRQLINQGVPAVKLLSESMGVAKNQIFDLASEGKISFDILKKAIADATSEGGMFADGMKKQSQTLNGLFSTLKDNINIALAEIGNSIVDGLDLKQVTKNVIERIKELTNAFRSLTRDSKVRLLQIVGAIVLLPPALIAVGVTVKTMSIAISIGTTIMGGMSLALKGIRFALGITAVQMKAVGASALLMGKRILIATGWIAGIASLFGAVVVAGQYLVDNFSKIKLGISNILEGMALNFEQMIGRALTSIRSFIEFIAGDSSLAGAIANLFDIDLSGLVNSTLGIDSKLKELSDSVASRQEELDFNIRKYNNLQWGSIKDSALNALDKAKSAVTNALDGIIDAIDIRKLFDSIEQKFANEELPILKVRLPEIETPQLDLSKMYVAQTIMPDIVIQTKEASAAFEYLTSLADTFTNSFGSGMANIVVQGERLVDVLENIGKLLLSSAIQLGIKALLSGGLGAGSGFFGSGGGLFGSLFGTATSVNDALITSNGDVVKFHPDDNILAMKDFSNLSMPSQNSGVSLDKVFDKYLSKLSPRDLYVLSTRGGADFG